MSALTYYTDASPNLYPLLAPAGHVVTQGNADSYSFGGTSGETVSVFGSGFTYSGNQVTAGNISFLAGFKGGEILFEERVYGSYSISSLSGLTYTQQVENMFSREDYILTTNQHTNVLQGFGGNDVFGISGFNNIDGGSGVDKVSFSYMLTDVSQITYDKSGFAVLDGVGIHDAIKNVELFNFRDETVGQHTNSALVDDLFYFIRNKDVFGAHLDATAHYNVSGWHEGRDPNAYFSTTGYLAANPDIASAGVNPLVHYDQNGWKEGRDPSAGFDNELYLEHNPDVKAAGIDPLSHFLVNGQAEGRQAYAAVGRASDFKHGSFDAEFYLLSNSDVAKAALQAGGNTFEFAYQHYQTNGWHEGRNPNQVFDVKGYIDTYGDVKAAGIDPLAHYDQSGWHEGRDPSAHFDTKQYLSHYTDVANAHVDPLTHFLTSGIHEGRSSFDDGHFG